MRGSPEQEWFLVTKANKIIARFYKKIIKHINKEDQDIKELKKLIKKSNYPEHLKGKNINELDK